METPTDAGQDHYATLGITPAADAPTIRAAYRALAQRHHPDKAGAASEQAVARMVALNEAYRVLGDPARRAEYDRHRDPTPRADTTERASPETAGNTNETERGRGHRRRGISAERYARRHGLSTEEVIDMIRCGDLVGFKRSGAYYVLPTAWRRESVAPASGDATGCLLALVAILVLVLGIMLLFVEE